jgi:hypothetical protein
MICVSTVLPTPDVPESTPKNASLLAETTEAAFGGNGENMKRRKKRSEQSEQTVTEP